VGGDLLATIKGGRSVGNISVADAFQLPNANLQPRTFLVLSLGTIGDITAAWVGAPPKQDAVTGKDLYQPKDAAGTIGCQTGMGTITATKGSITLQSIEATFGSIKGVIAKHHIYSNIRAVGGNVVLVRAFGTLGGNVEARAVLKPGATGPILAGGNIGLVNVIGKLDATSIIADFYIGTIDLTATGAMAAVKTKIQAQSGAQLNAQDASFVARQALILDYTNAVQEGDVTFRYQADFADRAVQYNKRDPVLELRSAGRVQQTYSLMANGMPQPASLFGAVFGLIPDPKDPKNPNKKIFGYVEKSLTVKRGTPPQDVTASEGWMIMGP